VCGEAYVAVTKINRKNGFTVLVRFAFRSNTTAKKVQFDVTSIFRRHPLIVAVCSSFQTLSLVQQYI
jgi:hypothetical protein